MMDDMIPFIDGKLYLFLLWVKLNDRLGREVPVHNVGPLRHLY